MFPIDETSIDKTLPIPVGTQLYGLLSYMLSHADIAKGTKLQSVRQLAAEIGVAPMTVSQVYQQLRDAGLVEMRRGNGAYSAVGPNDGAVARLSADALRIKIDALLHDADKLGISPIELSSMVAAQAQLNRTRGGLSLLFVGIFEKPARDYVAEIKKVLGPQDQIGIVTMDDLKNSADARAEAAKADMLLTLVHREAEVRRLVADASTFGIRFIPSAATRQALAALRPGARVAAVSYFEDYVAIMKPTVREFAPHVADIDATWIAAPDIAECLREKDAVIYATGADHIAELTPSGVPCFEFRHTPDPRVLENLLVPHLTELKRLRAENAGDRAATRLELKQRQNRRM